MRNYMGWIWTSAVVAILLGTNPAAAQLKLGYVDSQKILESYQEAVDAQKQLAEVNKAWEEEARQMQRELVAKQDELESQALLLSDAKRKEKETDIQNLMLQFQQFQQEKWGQQGEVYKKQADLMKPIIDKVNAVIRKIGGEEKFDYIFDVVAGNILHVSDNQPDLTEKIITELNKTVAAGTPPTSKK